MHSAPEYLKSNLREALGDERLHAAVLKATDHSLAKRAEVVAEVPDWEALRDRAANLRDHTLADLDGYLLELEEHASAKGMQVHWAPDAAAGNGIIADICRRAAANGRARVVKSKSMTTEEMGLTPHLESLGMDVVETDLGEYIVQLAGQAPSHITAPALHLSRADVGRIFADKLGVPFMDDPVELIAVARQVLRDKFLQADVGITGVNFAVAETGTPLMVENEGNGRLVSALPHVQIAVMGIEKVVPTWDDLMVLLELLPRSATGQRITGSVVFFSRPSLQGEADGPRELHLVILDNGRTRALADPQLRSALRCIRCGACLNVCPVYRRCGGHAYGWIYPGPIGAVLAPLFLGAARAPDHPFASTLCGRCSEICPVKIELPHLLLVLRDQVARQIGTSAPAQAMWHAWQYVMQHPEVYRGLASIPHFLLHDVLGGRWTPDLPVWGQDRATPELAPECFAELFRREFPDNVR